jgi:B12-binding domain/radical SAM domain protein
MLIIFNITKKNKYSFAPLAAILEEKMKNAYTLEIASNSSELVKILEENEPHEMIISCHSFMSVDIPDIQKEIETLRNLKKEYNMLLIAGGAHPTADPVKTLNLGFDIAVMGEGESSFPRLVEAINRREELTDIPGIAFIRNNRIQINPVSEYVELDMFPPFSATHSLFSPIEISRGCPWGCKYCQTPWIFGRRMRHRSIDSITKYASIARRHGHNRTWFISPNALAYGGDGVRISHERVIELLKALKKMEMEIYFGTFPSEVRPEFITEDIMVELSEYVSNRYISIGAQSGSQRLLDHINRGHGVEDVLEAVDISVSHGFIPKVDIIFGLPTETHEDVLQTVSLIKEIVRKGAKIHVHTFMPLPGTPFYREKPGVIQPPIGRFLSQLAKKGHVSGSWIKQEKIGRFLYDGNTTTIQKTEKY